MKHEEGSIAWKLEQQDIAKGKTLKENKATAKAPAASVDNNYHTSAQRKTSDDFVETALDVAAGIALGEAVANIFSNGSSEDNASGSGGDWSGGDGGFSGAGSSDSF
jgi:hypothetical protein